MAGKNVLNGFLAVKVTHMDKRTHIPCPSWEIHLKGRYECEYVLTFS